jgi:hypothetical protein
MVTHLLHAKELHLYLPIYCKWRKVPHFQAQGVSRLTTCKRGDAQTRKPSVIANSSFIDVNFLRTQTKLYTASIFGPDSPVGRYLGSMTLLAP